MTFLKIAETGTDAKAGKPLVLARGVHKTYAMGETFVYALRGVDFTVERGEFVAIVGQSGSGKSTLMHLLGCLDTPSSGEIFMDGEDISTCTESELAGIRNRTVGFMFQTFNLLSRVNLLRNTELPLVYAGVGARRRRRMAKEMLVRLGLGDRLNHCPNQLSGGQCQRAALARALVTDPRILLADEPTGNLDSESGAAILDLLRDLHSQGRTIILVTHDAEVAGAADRLIRLRDGCIIEDTKTDHAKEKTPHDH